MVKENGVAGQHSRIAPKRNTEVTAVGFEPTPLRTGALSQRLRPLGQTVIIQFEKKKLIRSSCCEQILHARLRQASATATYISALGCTQKISGTEIPMAHSMACLTSDSHNPTKLTDR